MCNLKLIQQFLCLFFINILMVHNGFSLNISIKDVQPVTTIHFKPDVKGIHRISGAKALQTYERDLFEKNKYFIWRVDYTAPYLVDRSFLKKQSTIEYSQSNLNQIMLEGVFEYGVQKKSANIHFLGYIYEFSGIEKNIRNIDVQFNNKGCILWHKQVNDKLQVALKVGCGAFNYMVKKIPSSVQKKFVGAYFGIEMDQLKSFKGGVWQLSSAAVSRTQMVHIQKIKAQESEQEMINLSYQLVYPAKSLTIDIPFHASFASISQGKHLDVLLEAVNNRAGDYQSIKSRSLNNVLVFQTNQSITGISFELSCDNQLIANVNLNNVRCALINAENENMRNELKVFLQTCVKQNLCSGVSSELLPDMPVRYDNTTGIFIGRLDFLASGIGLNQPGIYSAELKITATTHF